jgi:hypothetical protein
MLAPVGTNLARKTPMTQAELVQELERLVAEATASRERLREIGAALAQVKAQLTDGGESVSLAPSA